MNDKVRALIKTLLSSADGLEMTAEGRERRGRGETFHLKEAKI